MNARKQMRLPTGNDADWRWQGVVARDPGADGKFFYSVKTTGVYCRPSCASRLAKRENVAFHKTQADAEAAGFRACKRCKPGKPIFDTGFNSGGRFYETSHECLGMTPSAFRAGGENTNILFAIGQSSLGPMLVAKSAKGVCAILLGADPESLVRDLQDQFPKANLLGGDKDFEKLVSKVVGLIEAPRTGVDLPLDIRGTAFQQRVWRALRKIPVGTTASYTDIARRIGSPKSVRAVAQACGANSIAVAIPCHRVVRTDGGLSGYRWGVERKRALLERETTAR